MTELRVAKEYLHLGEWLGWAAKIAVRGKAVYLQDRLLQEAGDALMMKIGEAANRLDRLGVEPPPNVAWSTVVSNRNLLIHRYDEIDREITWTTLATSLPSLAAALAERIAEAGRVVAGGPAVDAADVMRRPPFAAE